MLEAVITGDIIHSSKLSDGNKTLLLDIVAKELKQWGREYKMRSEIFRGDSFQCRVKNPKDALRMGLIIKTYIRSLNPGDIFDLQKRNKPNKRRAMLFTNWILDVRLAIGIGKAGTPAKSLALSHGKAFMLSGHLLDEMKKSKQHLSIRSDDKHKEELKTLSVLLDAIISRTTALQCEVITLKLLGHTEIQIAEMLKIMQSAVNQRSNSGNWNAIAAAVERFETIYPG